VTRHRAWSSVVFGRPLPASAPGPGSTSDLRPRTDQAHEPQLGRRRPNQPSRPATSKDSNPPDAKGSRDSAAVDRSQALDAAGTARPYRSRAGPRDDAVAGALRHRSDRSTSPPTRRATQAPEDGKSAQRASSRGPRGDAVGEPSRPRRPRARRRGTGANRTFEGADHRGAESHTWSSEPRPPPRRRPTTAACTRRRTGSTCRRHAPHGQGRGLPRRTWSRRPRAVRAPRRPGCRAEGP